MEEQNTEELKKKNEILKITIQQLRKQLEIYRKKSKKKHEWEGDFVPYHEEERD